VKGFETEVGQGFHQPVRVADQGLRRLSVQLQDKLRAIVISASSHLCSPRLAEAGMVRPARDSL
jgi:hypothetical protein